MSWPVHQDHIVPNYCFQTHKLKCWEKQKIKQSSDFQFDEIVILRCNINQKNTNPTNDEQGNISELGYFVKVIMTMSQFFNGKTQTLQEWGP